jgi:hypothetical protein
MIERQLEELADCISRARRSSVKLNEEIKG